MIGVGFVAYRLTRNLSDYILGGRRYRELARDYLTLPDYPDNRFHDDTGLLRVLSAMVILFFFTV